MVLLYCRLEPDGTALRRKFDRVSEAIIKNFLHPQAISIQHSGKRIFVFDAQALGGRALLNAVKDCSYTFGEIEWLARTFQLASLDFTDLQNLVDNFEQMP